LIRQTHVIRLKSVYTVFIRIKFIKNHYPLEDVMKRFIIFSLIIPLSLFFMLMATGCDSSGISWSKDPGGKLDAGNWKLSLSENGSTRTVYVHIPSGYSAGTGVPLLLDFHGYMDTPSGQYNMDNFIDKSDAEGFIVAYPKGYGTAGFLSWNAGKACCGSAVDKNLDDVKLARDIVTLISSRCSIDPKRVYVHGHSNGAGLAHRIAREAADVFAAISPTSMPVLVQSELPSRPISVIQFHGTADTTIYPGGGTIFGEAASYMSAKESLANWAAANGCTGSPVTKNYGDSYCETYQTCSGNVKVALCMLKGSDHNYLYSNSDIDATEMSWDFMSQFIAP
jgi:polyhydroxybutyrate depolymerase